MFIIIIISSSSSSSSIIETICYNFIRIDNMNERMNERRLTVSGRSINDDVMLRLFPEFAPFCSSILEPNLAESSSVKFGRILTIKCRSFVCNDVEFISRL